MTTLEDLQQDVKDFREETREGMSKLNGRVRAQELFTARLQGALAIVAMLGIGNVVAIVIQRQ